MSTRGAHWIILTSHHMTETFIPSEGDFYEYTVAPNDRIKKDDTVYFWWNPGDYFYGWGVIAETPHTFLAGGFPKIKQQKLLVSRKNGFNPRITAPMMLRDERLKNMVPTGAGDVLVLPLRPGQANYLNDFIREHNLDAPQGSETISWIFEESAPQIFLQAILTFGDQTKEGRLVEGVRVAWDEIIKRFANNPDEIYKIDPWKFEELIAGAYERAGYDEVILTPRSNDKGRDIIATKLGIGSIRIFDQVKRYRISHFVTAEEVRALIGVISIDQNVSKGVITTTSDFAPTLLEDENIKRLVPHRLELRPRSILLPWLNGLRIR